MSANNRWDGLITLRDGDTVAAIAPALGANCVAFAVDGRAVIEPVPGPDALRAGAAPAGCPVLFPFPGRVAQGRYTVGGREYTLPLNVDNGRDHRHGLVTHRPWRVARRDAASCTCVVDDAMLTPAERAGYPWPFALTLTWRVAPGRLRADVTVENRGDEALPFGFGLHPYLAAPPDAVVRVPAASAWPLAAGMMAGDRQPAGGPWPWAALAEAASLLLTDLPPGTVEATAGATAIRFPGDRFGEVVVYRPPARPAVCVEPWTSVAGAANLLPPGAPHGLLLLPPGATWDAWVELALAPLGSPPTSGGGPA
ncbi:MAG TPA: hypothetical protein VFL91_28770 [Thermomicrobiales bacterium]|nr:hypothetical protein [Thermomicrobiales bacterium]